MFDNYLSILYSPYQYFYPHFSQRLPWKAAPSYPEARARKLFEDNSFHSRREALVP
jgi:hypothetical protein